MTAKNVLTFFEFAAATFGLLFTATGHYDAAASNYAFACWMHLRARRA